MNKAQESENKSNEILFDENNYILEINEDFDDSRDESAYANFDNKDNFSDFSTDKKFDLMLEEMQICLQEASDARNIVQNIAKNKSECYSPLNKQNNSTDMASEVYVMNEIFRQKNYIDYLLRDKQELNNQLSDLNFQLLTLKEENKKLLEELTRTNFKDIDCSKFSNYGSTENTINNDTSENRRSTRCVSFLRSIDHGNPAKETNNKSSSWSELRTNKIIQDESFVSMIPMYRRTYSDKYQDAANCQVFLEKNINNDFGENIRIKERFNYKSDFKTWTTNQVCEFLNEIGLEIYVNNCKRLFIDGLHLIASSKKDIEKELNIKNKLHSKKLLIHIRRLTNVHVKAATYFCLTRPDLVIDSNFDTRLWLDDIGLLHYMDVFVDNGLDGYMLDQITLIDLQHLKITNELHTLSIKRGIQYLRMIDYNLSVFIRRPSENSYNCENGDNSDLRRNIPKGDVCRWTQHQVAEWLRLIELPEYASNIRGSGIHGALMIFEDRFNANSLASVLNIPRGRSLLQRHLQTKFRELIGPALVTKKRIVSERPGFMALTATSKIKYSRKKGLFDGIKRKHTCDETEELLLPYYVNVENF